MDKRFKVPTTYHIDYSDLEELIFEYFGFRYELPCVNECMNDSALKIHAEQPSDYDLECIEEQKEHCNVYSLINKLVEEGLAPQGLIVIDVCW